jgi:acetyl-CoA C-acetyltransferase
VHPPSSHRSAVLVGVGAASTDAGIVELLSLAAHAAAEDAGAAALLGAVTQISLTQGSWVLTDPGHSLARRIGAERARSVRFEIGVSQQEVIDDALEAIASGRADVVLVVGAEARGFERRGGTEPDDGGGPPDDTVTRPPDFVPAVEIAAEAVWPPVQQYALIENALANVEGLSPAQQQADVSALWSRFNAVAAKNPRAAFPAPRRAAELSTPGPRNRPLAFPYNLWHSSQWTVDQSAALLICSTEAATTHGVEPDRWVFPHVALHSSQAIALTARRDLHRWPAMEVLGQTAARTIGRALRDIELTELYSCFPAAVRVQQRELGVDVHGTPTLTGGMSFAGGPFNHYVFQAMTELVPRLRAAPSDLGLITTVSGMLTKPGLAVWACHPPEHAPLIADLGDDARAATPVAPIAEAGAAGDGTVVSSTVTYGTDDPLQPVRTLAVIDLADGTRTAAASHDLALARQAEQETLAGTTVHVEGASFTP